MTEQIPMWMKRLLDQDVLEEKEESEVFLHVLDPDDRSLVWWLCTRFPYISEGVAGQACNLFERYIAKKFMLYSSVPRPMSEWLEFKEIMAQQVPLMVCVCIALTTKMMSTERQLPPDIIRDVLAQTDTELTLKQVNAMEMDVFSCLGFHIPMFTNVEKALMIGADVGFSGPVLKATAVVTDMAEYYRAVIQEEVIDIAYALRKDNTLDRQDITNMRHVPLVAGSVYATSMLFKSTLNGTDPLPRLTFLSQCAWAYIKCIGDVICRKIINECEISLEKAKTSAKEEEQ